MNEMASTVRDTIFTVNGATLGATCVGDGSHVLLLHAGGERRDVWTPVAESLGAAGFGSIAIDQRGHGSSTSRGADLLSNLATDVREIVRMCSAPPVLVGASLGGFAAIAALADPGVRDRVAGLVLVDVVPDPPGTTTRAWLARSATNLADHPIVDDIFNRSAELTSSARAWRGPTLLIRGGAGSPVTDDDCRRFQILVPHAEVKRIVAAGHLVARDAPELLARGLIDWLTTIRRWPEPGS